MGATINYTLSYGVYPINVSISPSVAPDQLQYNPGTYSFTNVPSGTYTLTFTDSGGCEVQLPADIIGTSQLPSVTPSITPSNSPATFVRAQYGLLYNWYAITDTRGIAPLGWHVPSDAELLILRNYLDSINNNKDTNLAGEAMKNDGLTYWVSPNIATNSSNLNFPGAGYRNYLTGEFNQLNYMTGIWSSTEFSVTTAGEGILRNNIANFIFDETTSNNKNSGYSVRLIKDDSNNTGTFVGNDGKVYPTITIGTQVWMGSNLAETRYRISNKKMYGALYNWFAVDKRNPTDWFLPSKDELYAIYIELYLHGVGNFPTDWNIPGVGIKSEYWTSSENLLNIGWVTTIMFYDGTFWSEPKYYDGRRIRACRTFTTNTVYSLRDTGPKGGLIFHIINNGGGSYTYYEAAPYDVAGNTKNIVWSNVYDVLIGTTGTAIGTGESNTNSIITQVGHLVSSALSCRQYGEIPKISPSGWHVPTLDDMRTLMETAQIYFLVWPTPTSNRAGRLLKEIGTTHWNPPNDTESPLNFNATGGGFRNMDGTFSSLKIKNNIWASTSYVVFTGIDGYMATTESHYIQMSNDSDLFNVSNIDLYNSFNNYILSQDFRVGSSICLIKDDSNDPGTLTDIDGNIYPTVKIGNQVWMAENLRVTHYNDDNTPIPIITDNVAWSSDVSGAMCYYNNDINNAFIDSNVIPEITDNTAWMQATSGALSAYNNDWNNAYLPPVSPTPTMTPFYTPTPTSTPEPTHSVTPTRSRIIPTPTPSKTPTITPSSTTGLMPSITPTKTPSITPSLTPGLIPSSTPTTTPTITPSKTLSRTPSRTPTNTPTITLSPLLSKTPSLTPSKTPSKTPSLTPSKTLGTTPTVTPSKSGVPGAKTYYIKNSGNDSNTGLSDAQAWATISKVNGFAFNAGDVVNFNRGDTWRESLTISSSGASGIYIVFSSYGSGNKPKILGSNVSTWSAEGHANIWVCDSTVTDPAVLGNGSSQGSDIFFNNNETITQGLRKTYSSNFSNLVAEYNWTYNSSKVYIYSVSNPNSQYTSIEIPQRDIPINLNQKQCIRIDGLDLRYFGQYGIYGGAYPSGNVSYLTIQNCDISWSGLITPNASNDKDNYGIHAVYSHMLIHNCTIHDMGRRSISLYNYANGFTVTDVIVENCTLYKGYHTTGIDIMCGNGSTSDYNGVIFRYNLIYDDANSYNYGSELMNIECYYSAVYIHNLEVYGNILMYPQNSGIHIYGIQNANIYNNTFIGHNIPASGNTSHIKIQNGCVGVIIKNNIFYSTLNVSGNSNSRGNSIYVPNSSSQPLANITVDYNIHYRVGDFGIIEAPDGVRYTYSQLSTIRSQYGWETHGQCIDPSFVSTTNYHLLAGSPAIHAGVNVSLTTDYDGAVWYNPPSIGAYEYINVTTPTPTMTITPSKTPSKTPSLTPSITPSKSMSVIYTSTIYYVSTSGSDSNNGLTTSTPWATLQYAESHATVAGSTIALKKGDVWSLNNVLAITHGGSTSHPIIWDGSLWGTTGSNAILRCSANRGDPDNAIVNFISSGCHDVTFKNIICDGNNKLVFGIVIGYIGMSNYAQDGEHDIIIDGCSILNIGNGTAYRQGFLCSTWNNNISNITIQNCTLDGADDEQLSFYCGRSDENATPAQCNNVYIGYNTLTNWGRRGQSTGYGMQINNKTTNVIIEHNTLTTGPNGHGNAFQLESNEPIAGWFPTGVTFRYNKVTSTVNNVWSGVIQGGQAMTADFYYNIFINTATGNSNTTGGCFSAWTSGIGYTGAVFNFYNNVFYNKTGNGIYNEMNTSGIMRLKNNIFYSETPTGAVPVLLDYFGYIITHTNNLYYRSVGASELKVQSGGSYYYTNANITGWESTAQVGDPLFNTPGSDFHLQGTSIAINAGTSITTPVISVDYDGIIINSPPEIGAYEYIA